MQGQPQETFCSDMGGGGVFSLNSGFSQGLGSQACTTMPGLYDAGDGTQGFMLGKHSANRVASPDLLSIVFIYDREFYFWMEIEPRASMA